MQKVKYYVRSVWAERILAQWVTNVIIGVHIGLGFAILAGGATRFTPPTYQPLLDLTSDKVWIWAVWILFSAVLIMTPFKWINAIGLWLGMFWHFTWAGLFLVAVNNYPIAGATPVVMYLGAALINAALLTVRVIEPRGD